MKFYWLTKKCFVPECTSAFVAGNECVKEFFGLPADCATKLKWLNAILVRDSAELKVCEEHFRVEDFFVDENKRKRLKASAVPSKKLPRFICRVCLGWKKDVSNNYQENMCSCVIISDAVAKEPAEKRVRMFWSRKEKYALFGMVKTYGNMRVTARGHFLIDWETVTYKYREYGFFGNEAELRSLWQSMKRRVKTLVKNQGMVQKLDKKIYRFLYGKQRPITANDVETERPKILLRISLNNESGASNDIAKEMVPTSSDNESSVRRCKTESAEDRTPIIVLDDDEDEADKSSGFDEMETDDNSEEEAYSEDEYWGLEDLEKKLGISIGKYGCLTFRDRRDEKNEVIVISDSEC
ncbi:uncharacterized protein LOC132707434 [Cylas formicarius]|uniref:uncharacterized protein LOC132707434 n=1 Tax=Cylas formicarius TaxID=197179 RepID=UPI0029587A27|nr:uncharacterized protein LOC132707434 [Cylas formicarius]XP_060535278.1 uncharacterized protein LOC132707434 [Cylas formicarius]